MSSAKGDPIRKRPQRFQNRTSFKNDLHDTSQKTKFLNSLQIVGVCNRCKDILDWKIKYKKYKTLSAPRKCVSCEGKTVKFAYHVLCTKCAREKKVCAKCCTKLEDIPEATTEKTIDIESMLKILPERKRRTVLRFISKNQGSEGNMPSEMVAHIEDMISKLGLKNDDDDEDDDDSDENNSNSCSENLSALEDN